MLKKVSLKIKLLIIVIPLIFSLILASAYIIKNSYNQTKQFNGLVSVSQAFENFGKLISNLQTERGKSTLFLANKLTHEELSTHRKDKTDIEIAASKKIVMTLPLALEHTGKLDDALASITTARQEIDAKSATITEVLANYSQIVREILILEGHAANLYAGNGIEIKMMNITLLETLKEQLGITRASYASAFAMDAPLTSKELNKLLSTRSAILSLKNAPSLEQMPDVNEKIGEIFLSADWKNISQDLDKILEKSSTGHFGVDPKIFFEKITLIFERIKSIIQAERLQVIDESKIAAIKAANIVYSVSIAIILIVLCLIIFSWKIIQDLIIKEENEEILNRAAARSASMVENSPIATLMCNPSGDIIFLNNAAKELFKNLAEYIPINVLDLMGKNIETIPTNPPLQIAFITNPKELPKQSILELGSEKIEILITASINNQGVYLGTAISWTIITHKLNLIDNLTKSSNDLKTATQNVLSISNNLSASAEETSAQANTAGVATEEVNAGVQSVSNSMKEMTLSIKEITKSTNDASNLSSEALLLTTDTQQIINKLGESSLDIGNVIKVITSIAQQTNLLALNATIEAARAGEAGKGFSVVANEVKELANQTAKATNEITKKIEAIQLGSQNAISAVDKIHLAIEKVNSFTSNIATAIEEQLATTNEVSRIMLESSQGVKQINENMSQVSLAATNTGKDANYSLLASKKIGEISNMLNDYVAALKN